jgi:hypothetical protein
MGRERIVRPGRAELSGGILARLTRLAIFVKAFLIAFIAAQPTQVASASSREEEAWRRALAQNTASSYYDYLSRYPAGQYVEQAMDRLDRLGALKVMPRTRQMPSQSANTRGDRDNRGSRGQDSRDDGRDDSRGGGGMY